jgi:hypothetical protein
MSVTSLNPNPQSALAPFCYHRTAGLQNLQDPSRPKIRMMLSIGYVRYVLPQNHGAEESLDIWYHTIANMRSLTAK